MQSVLSKPLRENGQVVEYPMQQRIRDVVEYVKMARGQLPDVEIGIIDALPSKGQDYQGRGLTESSPPRWETRSSWTCQVGSGLL